MYIYIYPGILGGQYASVSTVDPLHTVKLSTTVQPSTIFILNQITLQMAADWSVVRIGH